MVPRLLSTSYIRVAKALTILYGFLLHLFHLM